MRIGLYSSALSALLFATTPAFAQGVTPAVQFRVPAGPLQTALPLFAAQSGEQILYSTDLVVGRQSPGVTGVLRTDDALAALLEGTGLRARRTRPNTLIIVDPAARAEGEGDPTQLEEIVVTGSLIRGVADGPSPVVTVTRDDIDRDGHATVAQALAGLPQNFGGTANEGALQNGADRSASNGGFASGVNLRGLGSDATLVLINGRRMSGTGAFGDFADVSTVPTSAIARIDVLLDGASALYGSDAVGGVVNIILRRDYDGVETRVRYGQAADGATQEYQVGQTVGHLWSGGGLLGSYEYYDREPLAAADRPLAGNADLRPLGGSDRRLNYANPGNIVVYNAALGGYVSAFAIPSGQNGRSLTRGDFLAGETNRSNQRQGMNVLPRQERHSFYLSGHQDLGSRVTVSADARWGRREWETVSAPIVTLITATPANPFYVSPTGAASQLIAYSFLDELPNPVLSGDAESLGLSLGADLTLAGDWRLSGYVAYAADESENRGSGVLNSVFLREALGTLADNPATPFSAARDGYFNPFSDGGSSSQAVLDFLSSGWNYTRGKTEVRSANLQLDGTVWTLPGGPLKLAAGLSLRRENFSRESGNLTAAVTPTIGVPAEFDRQVFSAFAEVRAPLFGDANARPGLKRLELSLAARYEDYDDIGSTLNPKVGVVWEVSDSLLFRANYGSSFRAPALREIHDSARQSPTFLTRGAGTTLSLILYGGNPDLRPEEADTWTAGLEYRPSAIDGLRLGLNWFRTDFDQRIGQPALNSVSTVLTDPALASFVRFINPTGSAEDRAVIQALLDLPSTVTGGYPATAFGAIVDARYVNTTRVEVEGLDANLDYPFTLRGEAFKVSANLSYLDRFDSQNTPTAPLVSTLNRPNEPIGLRGRGTLRWSRGPWSVSTSVNYVDSYHDINGDRIQAWATADAQIVFAPETGPFAGSTIGLNVQNVFDRDPPFWDGPEGIAYDAANANVLGRFISLQLTRAW